MALHTSIGASRSSPCIIPCAAVPHLHGSLHARPLHDFQIHLSPMSAGRRSCRTMGRKSRIISSNCHPMAAYLPSSTSSVHATHASLFFPRLGHALLFSPTCIVHHIVSFLVSSCTCLPHVVRGGISSPSTSFWIVWDDVVVQPRRVRRAREREARRRCTSRRLRNACTRAASLVGAGWERRTALRTRRGDTCRWRWLRWRWRQRSGRTCIDQARSARFWRRRWPSGPIGGGRGGPCACTWTDAST